MKQKIVVASTLFVIIASMGFYFYKRISVSVHKASWDGNIAKVKSYIENNPELLDLKDQKGGMTPLHYAAWHGKSTIVEYLIRAGANVNAQQDIISSTPLIFSVASNYLDTSEMLLKSGADVNARDFAGMTALHSASRWGHLEMVELLIDYEASLNIESNESSGGYYPLHLASSTGHLAVVESLIDEGAMVDCKSVSGGTPLHCAVESGSADIVELLLIRGADPHIEDTAGKTAYARAKEIGQENILKLLEQYP